VHTADDGGESSDDEEEGGAAAPGEGDEDGFERIKSRQEKKKDKLLSTDPTEITYDVVAKKLREIVVARGKKGIDRSEQARSEPQPSCETGQRRQGHAAQYTLYTAGRVILPAALCAAPCPAQ
jgi:hypothetical protein